MERRAILLAVGAPTVSTVAVAVAKRRLGPRTKNIAKLAAVARKFNGQSVPCRQGSERVLKIWILRH